MLAKMEGRELLSAPLSGMSCLAVADAGCRGGDRVRWRSQRVNDRRMVPVNEVLEFGMKEIRSELVLLHFLERLVRCPAVCHSIGRRHHARAMPTSHAVNVDRLT